MTYNVSIKCKDGCPGELFDLLPTDYPIRVTCDGDSLVVKTTTRKSGACLAPVCPTCGFTRIVEIK